MSDRRVLPVDKRSLSRRDRLMSEPGAGRLIAVPSVSLFDLTGGNIPIRDDIRGLGRFDGIVPVRNYTNLAREPLSFFSTVNGDGQRESIMVGPRIQGYEMKYLLAFAAPNRILALDLEEVLSHWSDLDERADYEGLRKAHKTMPGWEAFLESKEQIRRLLSQERSTISYMFKTYVHPILRWKTGPEGKREIILNSPDDAMTRALQEQFGDDPDRLGFNPGMGLIYVAAYSSEREHWPKEDGFAHEDAKDTSHVGTIQIVAFATREIARQQESPGSVPPERDLQESSLLQLMDAHIEQHLG